MATVIVTNNVIDNVTNNDINCSRSPPAIINQSSLFRFPCLVPAIAATYLSLFLNNLPESKQVLKSLVSLFIKGRQLSL